MSQEPITLKIEGMTCAHCVASVTEEVSEVDGVGSITIDLHAGGTSVATVTTTGPVDPLALKAAVAEAGYALV